MYPVHPSQMGDLVQCPLRIGLMHMFGDADEGGAAADTGSAMHKAAAAIHTGKGVAEALEEMQKHLAEYPKADLTDAAGLFLKYANETRNKDAALSFPLVEKTIRFSIDPAPEDPTGEKIIVEGTVDQVRLLSWEGRHRAWDIKTSKKEPAYIRDMSMFQLASYCIGASLELGVKVEPGGVITPRHPNMWWPVSWKFEDIQQILLPVRRNVAALRAKQLWHVPNDGCRWCDMRSPDVCLPKLQELKLKGVLPSA